MYVRFCEIKIIRKVINIVNYQILDERNLKKIIKYLGIRFKIYIFEISMFILEIGILKYFRLDLCILDKYLNVIIVYQILILGFLLQLCYYLLKYI